MVQGTCTVPLAVTLLASTCHAFIAALRLLLFLPPAQSLPALTNACSPEPRRDNPHIHLSHPAALSTLRNYPCCPCNSEQHLNTWRKPRPRQLQWNALKARWMAAAGAPPVLCSVGYALPPRAASKKCASLGAARPPRQQRRCCGVCQKTRSPSSCSALRRKTHLQVQGKWGAVVTECQGVS